MGRYVRRTTVRKGHRVQSGSERPLLILLSYIYCQNKHLLIFINFNLHNIHCAVNEVNTTRVMIEYGQNPAPPINRDRPAHNPQPSLPPAFMRTGRSRGHRGAELDIYLNCIILYMSMIHSTPQRLWLNYDANNTFIGNRILQITS